MSDRIELYTPSQARELLGKFVAQVEHSPIVEDYQDLTERVDSEVGFALTSLIIQTGYQPVRRGPTAKYVLENNDRHTKVQAEVGSHFEEEDPTIIQLFSYNRDPIHRIRRRKWAQVGIDGVGPFSAADDGENFYMPYTASNAYIGLFRDEVGGLQVQSSIKTETGLEIAGKAISESSEILNGYLRVVASLTKRLVDVDFN